MQLIQFDNEKSDKATSQRHKLQSVEFIFKNMLLKSLRCLFVII